MPWPIPPASAAGPRRPARPDTFGRVLCNTRDQHFVVDGPVQNGCPGEAVTPGELFLTSIAACGVELIEVFARQEEVPLDSVHVEISGELDLDDPVRTDFTVFRTVDSTLSLGGVDPGAGRASGSALPGPLPALRQHGGGDA